MTAISEFITLFKSKDRPVLNRYRISMNTDKGDGLVDANTLNLACAGVTLPGQSVISTGYSITRHEQYFPHSKRYPDKLTMEFYLFDIKIKKFFQRWMDKIIDPKTLLVSYDDTYRESFTIEALAPDDDSRILASVEVTGAYPSGESDLEFSSSKKDDIATVRYEFSFDELYFY